MLGYRYNNIINAVWYQALWFTAILGRENYEWALVLLLALHFAIAPNWRADFKMMLACSSIGIAVDSAFTYFGLYVFAPAPTHLPIPFWLMSIWLGFACTLLHSFSFFMTRPLIGTLIVATAAPFSYLAGVRFDAISFGLETPIAMIIIGGAWLVMMPTFAHISSVFRPESTQPQLAPKEA